MPFCAQYLPRLHSVGPPGIEPGLHAPKASVLPLYYGPHWFNLAEKTLPDKQACAIFNLFFAPIAQWIEQQPSKLLMRVRFLLGALVKNNNLKVLVLKEEKNLVR